MKLDNLSALLDPTPLPIETGYERLADGSLHVAARTDMHGCRGEMLEWWFRWRCDDQKYTWWHPIDHEASRWQGELSETTHVGSEHLVTERLTGLPAAELLIQFRDPGEFFDPEDFAKARESRAVTGAVMGRFGFGWEPDRLPDGRVLGGRLIHLARDTDWGMALRSHFFVGSDLAAAGLDPAEVEARVPDALGPNLLQHAYDEFTFLSRFLPSLHLAETRDKEAPPRAPW